MLFFQMAFSWLAEMDNAELGTRTWSIKRHMATVA
jgi:hypothetical protein